VTALISGLNPRFKITHTGPKPELEPLSSARFRRKLSNLIGSLDLGQEIEGVYAMLRHFIMDKEKAIAAKKLTDAEFNSFGSDSQYLSYRLIGLVQSTTGKQPGRETEIFRLFGLAGLAHIFTFSFKLPRPHVRFFTSTQIRACLEKIDIRTFQISYPEV